MSDMNRMSGLYDIVCDVLAKTNPNLDDVLSLFQTYEDIVSLWTKRYFDLMERVTLARAALQNDGLDLVRFKR